MNTTVTCSQAEMERRLVRFSELRPCTTAFIDTRTPGNQKENFTIIGPGVAENPDQYVHIDIPHGFNIGGVRQQPHCVNSQHSHETAEVFIIQNGRWAFRWGVDAEDGEVILGPGDVISIPVRVFRGFENVGQAPGYMCAVLGGDDPGRVTWAPAVFELAREHGLVLLESGQLIDTGQGEAIPEGACLMPPTTPEIVNGMRRMSLQEMQGCVYLAAESAAASRSELAGQGGMEEIPVIGAASPAEKTGAGKMNWPHGFQLRCLKMPAGASIARHFRREAEVIYLYEGSLKVAWPNGNVTLGRGDVLTIPKLLNRSFHNVGDAGAVLYVVRGGDHPAAPEWV